MPFQKTIPFLSFCIILTFAQCKKENVAPQAQQNHQAQQDPEPVSEQPFDNPEYDAEIEEKTTVSESAGLPIWKRKASESVFFFNAKLLIDADGAPRCYHPDDSPGMDDLFMAGKPGNWWALATDNKRPDGEPLIQGPNDPAPGFYISTTSLFDPSKAYNDPHRFVNAEEVPYYVLPQSLQREMGAKLGDFGAIITPDGKISYAVFADVGPEGKLGEASMFSGAELGINNDPRYGGIQSTNITYIVFTGSSKGWPISVAEIRAEGERLLNEWGSKEELRSLIN
ncbi:MAG: glycoside hydrolase family 75 protein [Cytophagaceae bacterium]